MRARSAGCEYEHAHHHLPQLWEVKAPHQHAQAHAAGCNPLHV